MRVIAAAAIFIATAAVVFGAGAAIYYAEAASVAGVVFILLWVTAALALCRVAYAPEDRHFIRWAILGLVLGPLASVWLAWKAAPHALTMARQLG